MMRRLLRIFASLAFAVAPICAQSQSPPAHAAGSYSISGVVVSALTGQPLDRVVVTLQNAMGESLVGQTETGSDGRFIFEHLRAGKFALSASRRGYIGMAYDEHEGYSTAIVTGEGLNTDRLTFRLRPRAVIRGFVSDDTGDPVQDARVSLYRIDMGSGLGNIVRAGNTTTDDTGAYEFPHLDAGNYYIAVTANPWYATRPQPRHDAEGNVLPDDQRSPLDVAYPTTFYADVTDSDSATPIPVKAGDQVQVNLILHAVAAVHLSVQLGLPPGRGFVMPQLTQEIFGVSEPAQTGMAYNWGIREPQGNSGQSESELGQTTVELSGVAPGHYSVELHGGGDSNRSAVIEAASDTHIDFSQAAGMADVSGKMVMDSGDKLPERLNISLRSSDGRFGGSDRVNDDGTFAIQGVPPGSYEIWVNAPDKSLAITHLTASGAPADGNTVKIGTASVVLNAGLVQGSATLTGFATRDGKPASGVMILLVPRNPAADRELFRRDQSDSDGSFQLNRVVPGQYTLVAIEDGWTLDWARPEVIAHYLPKGTKIIVPAQAKDYPVKDRIEVQAK
ncbi:MAG: carboxypeptidase regulatory-like domain-containing protein [Silvibacterium sp.]|nr:carboxypeptidase regulatory-like domain-containing protein [Silvibacterium sp.]